MNNIELKDILNAKKQGDNQGAKVLVQKYLLQNSRINCNDAERRETFKFYCWRYSHLFKRGIEQSQVTVSVLEFYRTVKQFYGNKMVRSTEGRYITKFLLAHQGQTLQF